MENKLRLLIERLLKEVYDATDNRHMNDFEYGRVSALNDLLELIDEM